MFLRFQSEDIGCSMGPWRPRVIEPASSEKGTLWGRGDIKSHQHTGRRKEGQGVRKETQDTAGSEEPSQTKDNRETQIKHRQPHENETFGN